MLRTVSIPVKIEEIVLLPLMAVCSSVFNIHTEWSYNNKTYNKSKAHQNLYESIRLIHPNFPSGYIQTIRDNAMECTKAFWAKKKVKSFKRRRINPNKLEKLFPVRGETSSVRLDRRTCTLRGEQFSFSTLEKRHKVILKFPEYFQKIISTWKFQAATITYQYKKDSFVIRLIFKMDTPEPSKIQPTSVSVVGIDRGIINLCAFSDGTKISGSKVNAIRRRYLFVRKTLQEKGTRSAKRRLKSIGGREKRFIRDVNHCLTKQIAAMPFDFFVLEKLTGIRNKNRGRKRNKMMANWAYFQMELFLAYKLEAVSKHLEYVDARYTSQKCSMCGHIAKANRNGGHFICLACGHMIPADLNASIVIRDRFLSYYLDSKQGVRQSPMTPETISGKPLALCQR